MGNVTAENSTACSVFLGGQLKSVARLHNKLFKLDCQRMAFSVSIDIGVYGGLLGFCGVGSHLTGRYA
ncbi:hypothetical protein DDN31_18295 [Vibrio cholerae]|nr:hypothetical protein [Vibrio cholerae]